MDELPAILFEDAHCLAVVKRAGELTSTMPAHGPSLEEAVRRHLRPGDPSSVYLGTVHRLDRPVSGVVLWAKTPRAARRLAEEFASRRARKEYWAVVSGAGPLPVDDELWEDWLLAPDAQGVARTAPPGTAGARRALTRVRNARAHTLPEGTRWLRLWPETGRTHQLRAQTSARGLPIVGDAVYGSAFPFGPAIGLHARTLQVRHPILREPIELVAPLPRSWADAGLVLPPEPRPR
jgi:23S rRNA pseudouridine1911/1915/1917 synthase